MYLYGESKITRIETYQIHFPHYKMKQLFIWRIQDNKDWNGRKEELIKNKFQKFIWRIQDNKDWNTLSIINSKSLSKFIWRIQDNKDWNLYCFNPPSSSRKFIWRIQDNKDWNTAFYTSEFFLKYIYMENPR